MKGILFKQGLFESVVSGDKTQTRRLLKLRGEDVTLKITEAYSEEIYTGYEIARIIQAKELKNPRAVGKARYKKDEIVYLKEPYLEEANGEYYYTYGNNTFPHQKTKNKLFMPEKAARYFIKITDVRLERLDDITTAGIKAEGIELLDEKATDEDYKKAWKSLWNNINGKTCPYDSNPFVWVYDFELHTLKIK